MLLLINLVGFLIANIFVKNHAPEAQLKQECSI